MKEYGMLLGLTIRNRLAAFRAGSWRKDNGKLDIGRIAAGVVVALSLLLVAGMIIYAEIMLFRVLKTLGQAALLPGLAMLLSLVSTLLLSFFHVLSGLYFSRDTVWLAYLPVRSRSVMAAKMTEIWMGEELFSAAVLLPVFILYGIHLNADVLYYLRMVLIVLLAPVMPLSIVAFLTTMLARATSLARNKEALSMVFSLIILVGVLALEGTLLPKIPDDADMMFFVRLLLDNEGILSLLTSAFPPVLWALHGLQGDWMEFGMFVGLCVAVMGMMLILLGGSYLSICLKQSEQGTRKRKVKTNDKTWKQRSQLMAMFNRECSAVLRSPTIAFNCLPGIIMFPLILVMGFAGASSAVDVSVMMKELNVMLDQISVFDLSLIIAAMVGFSGFMNPAVATAISREGNSLEISRLIPVSARVQLSAKLMLGLAIDAMGVAVAVVILLVLLPGETVAILLGSVLAMLLCYAVSAMNLTLDAVRPNLTWTSEIQVIKQGSNVAIGMLIGLAAFALPVIPPLLLLQTTPAWRFAASAAVLVLEALLGYLLVKKVAEKRYQELEPAT